MVRAGRPQACLGSVLRAEERRVPPCRPGWGGGKGREGREHDWLSEVLYLPGGAPWPAGGGRVPLVVEHRACGYVLSVEARRGGRQSSD